MVDTIEVYAFEDADGHEFGGFTTTDVAEAREYAMRHGLRIIALVYEFEDSAVIEDYTECAGGDDEEDVVLWDEYEAPSQEGGAA